MLHGQGLGAGSPDLLKLALLSPKFYPKPQEPVREFKLKTKNEKLKIKNGICTLRADFFTACGWSAKTPPQAVKQQSEGHRFSFSFFIFTLICFRSLFSDRLLGLSCLKEPLVAEGKRKR